MNVLRASSSRFLRLEVSRAWLWLWLVPALLLIGSSLSLAHWQTALTLTGQFSLLLALSSVVVPGRVLRGVLAVFLAVTAVAAVAATLLSATVWQDTRALSFSGLASNLSRNQVTTSAARHWHVPAASQAVLSFDARLAEGSVGWDWWRSAAALELSPLAEQGQPFTRVWTPTRGDPYLMRTFDLKRPAGGRTFRVELQMRAPQPVSQPASQTISAQGCRGVWLQTWGSGGSHACQAVDLSPDWRTFELEWTAPQVSESSIIRVILNDFEGVTYDVRGVKLYELAGDERVRLEPLDQEGVTLTMSWNRDTVERTFVPTGAWRRFTFTLEPPQDSQGSAPLHAALAVGSAQSQQTSVEVRDTQLTTSAGQRATPVPTLTRNQLWFAHPNLAAHTLASVGLAALATSSSLGVTLALSAVTALGVLVTQSRAALLALVLGVALLLGLTRSVERFFSGRIKVAALLLTCFFLGATALVLSGVLGSFYSDRPGVSRFDIWRVSAQVFWNHPWQGVGPDLFASFWRATYQGLSTEPIPHAHNLWLQLAASYGVPGLLAGLWLTGGLLSLAWRWGQGHGLALVVPVLVMNLFDYTFFYSGVLFPLVLALNTLRLNDLQQNGAQSRLEAQTGPVTSYTTYTTGDDNSP